MDSPASERERPSVRRERLVFMVSRITPVGRQGARSYMDGAAIFEAILRELVILIALSTRP